ncbi:MAG: extracellular solute-binding protein [Mycobacteriales bacterium]
MTAAGLTALLALSACNSDKKDPPVAASNTASAAPTTEAPSSAAPTTEAPSSAAPTTPGEKVTVNWFIGLGTGCDQGQPEKEKKVVDAFNAKNPDITLKMTCVTNSVAQKTLATQIAGGKGPDLVGPVGIRGANQFEGQWADLGPLIESQKFDTSIFSEEAMKSQLSTDGKQVALPFAVFPSALWYNKDLFDDAGVAYPPAAYGEQYEGAEWTWDKLREIAKKLTFDKAGKDATDPAFDGKNVVQWGYHPQFAEGNLQRNGTIFGAGSFGNEDRKTAQIPEQWLAGWKWRHEMIHKDKSTPNATQLGSDTLNKGNAFQTGKIAMAHTHLWYQCCVTDAKGGALTFWDLAATPSYNGTVTAPLHSDSIRILKDSKNKEAAFKVLTYFLTDGMAELVTIYGGIPARAELQEPFFAELDKKWTQKPNWAVLKEGLNHPDSPNHESWTPAFNKTEERAAVLATKINTEPNLDLDAEAEKMKADMQKLFDADPAK